MFCVFTFNWVQGAASGNDKCFAWGTRVGLQVDSGATLPEVKTCLERDGVRLHHHHHKVHNLSMWDTLGICRQLKVT